MCVAGCLSPFPPFSFTHPFHTPASFTLFNSRNGRHETRYLEGTRGAQLAQGHLDRNRRPRLWCVLSMVTRLALVRTFAPSRTFPFLFFWYSRPVSVKDIRVTEGKGIGRAGKRGCDGDATREEPLFDSPVKTQLPPAFRFASNPSLAINLRILVLLCG